MEREINLLNSVIDFLVSHGYPRTSLAIEMKIGDDLYADLAVVDPITNKTIAIFELKNKKTPQSLNLAKMQLKKYQEAMVENKTPAYMIFSKTNSNPPFEMYYLRTKKQDEDEEVEEIVEVPNYDVMKNAVLQESIKETKEKRKETINSFKIVCWLMAVLILFLLVMDLSGCIELTAERLTMVGAITGLIIIPFASKLKILGMEFERLVKED